LPIRPICVEQRRDFAGQKARDHKPPIQGFRPAAGLTGGKLSILKTQPSEAIADPALPTLVLLPG
jgi:hypothetical protein